MTLVAFLQPADQKCDPSDHAEHGDNSRFDCTRSDQLSRSRKVIRDRVELAADRAPVLRVLLRDIAATAGLTGECPHRECRGGQVDHADDKSYHRYKPHYDQPSTPPLPTAASQRRV